MTFYTVWHYYDTLQNYTFTWRCKDDSVEWAHFIRLNLSNIWYVYLYWLSVNYQILRTRTSIVSTNTIFGENFAINGDLQLFFLSSVYSVGSILILSNTQLLHNSLFRGTFQKTVKLSLSLSSQSISHSLNLSLYLRVRGRAFHPHYIGFIGCTIHLPF